MANDTLSNEQINPKQAISVFKKLTAAIKYQNLQIAKDIEQTKLQIGYFENNNKLIKSSKYYRFLNLIKNIFKL